MFYLYIVASGRTVMFLKSQCISVINGEDYYDESWYESPFHATQFHDPSDAVRHACEHHPNMSSAIMVMTAEEARGYV